jgi:hypothetical protein
MILPHLTPQKGEATNDRVREVTESYSVRPARVVGGVRLLSDPLIPVVTITIKNAASVAVDADIVTTKY